MSITILDGGMGQELVRRSGSPPTPLWATQVMLDRPGLVAEVHRDYFAAGAEIATANTYAIHRDRLRPAGMEDRFADLLDRAMGEAEAARDTHGSGRIAGSLGPLVASYRPNACPAPDVAAPLYAEIVARIGPRCDLLIAETVASVSHAEGVLRGAAGAGVPVWLAVTVDDEDGARLRSGEPVAALAPLVAAHGPAAVLANCSAPEAMAAALAALAEFGRPFGAYANGFKEITKAFLGHRPTVDSLQPRAEMTPGRYADFAAGWVGAGAGIVGGCCEVGPAHIAELKRRFA